MKREVWVLSQVYCTSVVHAFLTMACWAELGFNVDEFQMYKTNRLTIACVSPIQLQKSDQLFISFSNTHNWLDI